MPTFSHKIILSLKMPSAKVAAKKKADDKAKAKLGVKKTVKTKKVSKKVEKKSPRLGCIGRVSGGPRA